MNRVGYVLLGLCVPALCVLAAGCGKPASTSEPLLCHVGGTMRPVFERLAETFEKETGVAVKINSAGSGELLAHIELVKEGDLYVCHDPFLDVLMNRYAMGVDGWVVAELTPVIVVRKGNPKHIRGLADLTRPDVELLLTDYEGSTLGRMLPIIFARAGIDFDKLNRDRKIATHRSGGYVANAVKMGNVDAGIVWNAVAHLRLDGLDVVPIPPEHLPRPGLDAVTTATDRTYVLTPVKVTVATLTCADRPVEAKRFAEFVASDRGGEVFREFGFTVTKARPLYADGKKLE